MEEFNQEELKINREKELQKISEYDANEILMDLDDILLSTEVIIQGYTLSQKSFDGGLAITFAALIKARVGIENSIAWIKNNVGYEESYQTNDNPISVNSDNSEDEGHL